MLTPPEDFLGKLQQRLVDFVWSNKRHLLKKQIVYQKPDRVGGGGGGFGLVNLHAQTLGKHWTYSAIHTSVYRTKLSKENCGDTM